MFSAVRSVRILALASLVGSAVMAHASTISYSLLGVTTSAGTLTGFVNINTTTDLITSASITFNDAAVGNPVFNQVGTPIIYNGLEQDFISGPSNGPLNYGGQIGLYFNTANIGTGSLAICINNGPCGNPGNTGDTTTQAYVSSNNGGPFGITAGSLVPQSAAAPEPSSLMLLGTGIFGAAGMARRRSRA